MQGIAARVRRNLGETIIREDGDMHSRVDYLIREGKTAENIVDCAHIENIDLLVMTTHGSGGISRWNISSVTQKVINLIYLPILIVRSFCTPETDLTEIHYRRILIPIDSSRRAECTLPAGIALARGVEPGVSTSVRVESPSHPVVSSPTKLILTSVIRPPEIPITEPHPSEIKQLTDQLVQVSRLAANNYLDEIRARLSVECEICVLENLSAAAAIQEFSGQEEDIDLILLCAHGYSGYSAWPYGSVTRNYIEHGTKTTLVIQDVPRTQVRPTTAELAAEKSGRR
jgi:nucleotide-binding universal stress UspA family protein